MRKLSLTICILPFLLVAQKQPKLIVGIVIDQMRYEMLDRFRADFGPDGFNLLMREGMQYDSCTYSYIPTYTGPGHATIYTGTTPSIHGISSNDIYIPQLGTTLYCAADETVEPIGTGDRHSKRSPKNLRAFTWGDSIKMRNTQSKVIGVSIKDRGAILPGGKQADAAYWLDHQARMVSSSYYLQELPEWVKAFNDYWHLKYTDLDTWDYFLAPEAYTESLPDDADFESRSFSGTNALPYDIKQAIKEKSVDVIKQTPFANTMLTEFALLALGEENLGVDSHTDLLAISYSSTDYIGHAFGPQSVEVQDAYIRLDRDLAHLIKELDARVGRENYVMFLTSDHGAANTPSDHRFQYVSTAQLKAQLNTLTQEKFGLPLIKNIGAQQLWLDTAALAEMKLDRTAIQEEIKSMIYANSALNFAKVFTRQEVENCSAPDCDYFKRSFISAIAGDLFYILPFGYMERSENYGTTHGTSYIYDTHVPLLFFGGNVQVGESQELIHVRDIRRLLRAYLPEGF